MKFKKLLLLIVFQFIFLFISLTNASSIFANYYFNDEFDNQNLNSAIWEVYPGEGNYIVNNGKLIINSNGKSFPYIFTKNDVFPQDNSYELEIKFRYPNITPWGTGIVIQHYLTSYPDPPIEELLEHETELAIVSSWQDLSGNNHKIQRTNCLNCQNKRTLFAEITAPDTETHILKVIQTNNYLKVIIDNNEVYNGSPYPVKPKYIRFGNNHIVSQPLPWTSLEIDYVRVSQPKNPIIILPGMTACWNPVLVTGGEAENWFLVPSRVDSTYKPLLENLNLAGLTENEDYYVFCYDWRKPIEYNQEILGSFITSNITQDQKVDLVGHSMGGLLARAYTQNNSQKVNKLISIGSPNQGAAEAYFAWEGGILLDKNPWKRVIKELLIELKGKFSLWKHHTIKSEVPSIRDLLPTYLFLVDKNNPANIKGITTLNNVNQYLTNINNNLVGEIKEKMSIIFGNTGSETLNKVKVSTFSHPHANWLHNSSKMWEDGEPISQIIEDKTRLDYSPSFIKAEGDNTVTVSSSNINGVENYEIINDHQGIMQSLDGVFKIFNILGIDAQVQAVDTLDLSTVLALVLGSPANFRLTNQNSQQVGFDTDPNNQIANSFYDEKSKTIFIANPNPQLKLTVIGNSDIQDQGEYEINFLELTDNKLKKYRFVDKITANEEINYDLDTAESLLFINEQAQTSSVDSFKIKVRKAKENLELWTSLSLAKKRLINKTFDKALVKIDQFDQAYDSKNYRSALRSLYSTRLYLFRVRRFINRYSKNDPSELLALSINQQLSDAFSELNYLHLKTEDKLGKKYSPRYVKKKIKRDKRLYDYKNKKMQKYQDRNKPLYQYQAISFSKAEEYHLLAQHALAENKLSKALLYSTLSRLFLYEL